MNSYKFTQLAAISGSLAVGLGAFGAHALKTQLTPYQLDIWQTGVFYQFVHTLLLLFVSRQNDWFINSPRLTKLSCWSLTIGIILFSGSLYLLALTSLKWVGIITPIGGLLFITSWLLLLMIKRK